MIKEFLQFIDDNKFIVDTVEEKGKIISFDKEKMSFIFKLFESLNGDDIAFITSRRQMGSTTIFILFLIFMKDKKNKNVAIFCDYNTKWLFNEITNLMILNDINFEIIMKDKFVISGVDNIDYIINDYANKSPILDIEMIKDNLNLKDSNPKIINNMIYDYSKFI